MVRYDLLSFKDVDPNVKDNPLPKHGGENDVNIVAGCPGDFWIFDINLARGDLVKMHADLCKFSYYTHDHAGCGICSTDIQGYDKIKSDLQEMMDEGLIHIITPREEYEEDVNMVYRCPGEFWIFDVNHMNDDLVQLHTTFCHMDGQEEYHYGSCRTCCRDSRGCSIVRRGIQLLSDNGTINISGNRDDYNMINMIEDFLTKTVLDDENASVDEHTQR